MAPRNTKEMIVFLLNVGTSNSEFLQKAKHTIRRLIEKKIFLRPKDVVGLVLIGSEETKNEYDVNNIEIFDIIEPTWDLIHTVMGIECTDKTAVSWTDVLYITANVIVQNYSDFITRKICLFSDSIDMSEVENHFDPNKTAALLKNKDIGFLCIGKEDFNLGSEEPSSSNLADFQNFCKQIKGSYMSINHAIDDAKIYKRPRGRTVPWRCIMEIYGIKIPFAAYIKVRTEAKLPTWRLEIEEEPGEFKRVVRCREWLDKHRTERSPEDVIPAYIYGDKPIPFIEEDRKARAYKSGPVSYKVHSFVRKFDIGIEDWHGQGTYILVPGNDSAAKLFYTLMQAMIDNNLVALVRKVRTNRSAPKIVALYPRAGVPGDPRCFVEIQLPFCENRKAIESKPLKSLLKQLTKEQGDAVDDLLTSFALDEDGASYLPGCVNNPSVQHRWNALAARVIAPDEPVPPVDDFLQAPLKPPEYVKTKSAEHLDRVKQLFNLTKKSAESKEEFGD